ncbi:LuxR family transcriptional regulator [Leptospira barantonii]|uniref:LuxR family transcriptional regulator n=1 Tax=Leptospira barantonii TaxID=2023184 RepID=A0A5F2AYP3_9LEPT|nr:helix-turn-helix transcriptional regulator [Leptospira barantonii]TGL93513.1 LuxR family transcriptional regulator [Leptospira barantonii]
MKLKLLHPKGFYFFVFFIFNILLWMVFEGIEFAIDSENSAIVAKYVDYFEIWIGSLTLFGIYFIANESKRLHFEIQESKDLIQDLRHRSLLSAGDREKFWNGVEKQFEHWKYTRSEIEVAVYLLRGLSNQQIAGIRDTSLRTVEVQASSIYQKSGTRGKLDFIAYFIAPLLPDED